MSVLQSVLRRSSLTSYVFQNGESALHAASLFGHLKVVKELVQAGAKVDLKNKVCYYILH